jgi:hypothetical protein
MAPGLTSRALYTVLNIDVGSHKETDVNFFFRNTILYLLRLGAAICIQRSHMRKCLAVEISALLGFATK